MVKEAASEGRLAGAVEQGCRLYTAIQRAAQAADPKLHTQFTCVFKTLRVGAPHH
jgi:Flp pilus assembly protein TadB